MTEKTYWESFKAEGEQIVDTIRQLIHEGNVRRVVVQQHGRTIAEFPLTVGVVGAVLAPVVAAIGAIVARQRTAPSRSREAKRRTSRMRSRVRRWVDAGVSPSKASIAARSSKSSSVHWRSSRRSVSSVRVMSA